MENNAMLVNPSTAHHFIHHYQALLEMVAAISGIDRQHKHRQNKPLLLENARSAMLAKPQLRQQALERLMQQGMAWPQDMQEALPTLREDSWCYLRDTAGYAVFLDMHQDGAYAVQCLTTRLRDMLGASGAIIRCGLLVFQGQVVCDGLVEFKAWIGPSHKRSFNATVAEWRQNGRFYRDRVLAPPVDPV